MTGSAIRVIGVQLVLPRKHRKFAQLEHMVVTKVKAQALVLVHVTEAITAQQVS